MEKIDKVLLSLIGKGADRIGENTMVGIAGVLYLIGLIWALMS